MIRNWLVVGAALLLVGTAACGDDKDGGNDGAGGNKGTGEGTCGVFTVTELEDLLDTELNEGESLSQQVCDWRAVDETTGSSVSLQVFPGSGGSYDLTLEKLKENFSEAQYEDVSGIGDQAYIMVYTLEIGQRLHTLQAGARRGNDLIVVTTGGPGETADALIDATKELLKRAVDRT